MHLQWLHFPASSQPMSVIQPDEVESVSVCSGSSAAIRQHPGLNFHPEAKRSATRPATRHHGRMGHAPSAVVILAPGLCPRNGKMHPHHNSMLSTEAQLPINFHTAQWLANAMASLAHTVPLLAPMMLRNSNEGLECLRQGACTFRG